MIRDSIGWRRFRQGSRGRGAEERAVQGKYVEGEMYQKMDQGTSMTAFLLALQGLPVHGHHVSSEDPERHGTHADQDQQ